MGHSRRVTDVAISPNCPNHQWAFASSSQDGTVRLWNSEESQELIIESRLEVASVDFSRDCQFLAAADYNGFITIWNLSKISEPYKRLPFQRVGSGDLNNSIPDILDIQFSPNSQLIAAGDDLGNVTLWNWRTEDSQHFNAHMGKVTSVDFSPICSDSSLFLASAGEDKRINIWKVDDLNMQASLIQTLEEHSSWVNDVDFRADCEQLVSGDEEGIIKSWNMNEENFEFGQNLEEGHSPIHSVSFSSDGTWIAYTLEGQQNANTAPKNYISARTLSSDPNNSSNQKIRLEGHSGPITSAEFMPENLVIVSGGDDQTVRTWNIKNLDVTRNLLRSDDIVDEAAFSTDGTKLVSQNQRNEVVVWDISAQSFKLIEDENQSMRSHVDITNSRDIIVFNNDATISIWNFDGERLQQVVNQEIADSLDTFRADVSADGRLVAYASNQYTVEILGLEDDVDSLASPINLGEDRRLSALRFSLEGDFLVLGTSPATEKYNTEDYGTTYIWHRTEQFLQEIDALFLEDDRLEFILDRDFFALPTRDGYSINLWSFNGERMNSEPLQAHELTITSIVSSPDGKYLASVGEDGTVTLWDIRNIDEIQYQRFSHDEVDMVAFHPDSPILVTASSKLNNVIHIWSFDGEKLYIACE